MKVASLLWLALALASPGAAPAQQPAPAASSRQLFLFMFQPGPAWRVGVPMRQKDLRAHAQYHADLVREGRGFAGGAYVGMDGGMAIVRAATLAEAQAMLAADPAILNGVFTAELRHWQPRFHGAAPLVESSR